MAYDESFEFLTPAQINRPLPISIGLSGGSGSGKTYSALALARGIASEIGGPGAPIAFIDTENRRGLHYRAAFPEISEHYVDFGPTDAKGEMVGYPPERWIALLDRVERSDAKAVVVDSFTHAWEGINGVLELQAEIVSALGEGDANNIRGWAKVKPRYRKLINRIIQFSIPIILCTRAKPVLMKRQKEGNQWVDVPIGKLKTRRKDIPWDVAADGELIFEMTAMVILDHEHPGFPKYQVKVADQFKRLLPAGDPISEEAGRQMARWSKNQNSAAEDKALMDQARAKAREGRAAMRAWWPTVPQERLPVLDVILKELQKTAAEADQRVANADPFAEPEAPAEPKDDHPRLSPEEEERIAREIREETRREAERYERD